MSEVFRPKGIEGNSTFKNGAKTVAGTNGHHDTEHQNGNGTPPEDRVVLPNGLEGDVKGLLKDSRTKTEVTRVFARKYRDSRVESTSWKRELRKVYDTLETANNIANSRSADSENIIERAVSIVFSAEALNQAESKSKPEIDG